MILSVAMTSRVPWVVAQNPPRPPLRRWEISVRIGTSDGPTEGDLRKLVSNSGLAADASCLPPEPCARIASANTRVRRAVALYPLGGGGGGGYGATWSVAISYAVKQQLRFLLERVSVDWGGSDELRSSVTTWATAAVLSVIGPVRIGAGPSLDQLLVERSSPPGGERSRATRLGFVLLASVVTSQRARIFAEALAQYHAVGPVEVGPFGGGVTVPRTQVSLSYGTLQVGLGLHF
jgi:hypothetical protein